MKIVAAFLTRPAFSRYPGKCPVNISGITMTQWVYGQAITFAGIQPCHK